MRTLKIFLAPAPPSRVSCRGNWQSTSVLTSVLLITCSGCSFSALFGGGTRGGPADGGSDTLIDVHEADSPASMPPSADGPPGMTRKDGAAGSVTDGGAWGSVDGVTANPDTAPPDMRLGDQSSSPAADPDGSAADSGPLRPGQGAGTSGHPAAQMDAGLGSATPADGGVFGATTAGDGWDWVNVAFAASVGVPTPQSSSAVPAARPDGRGLALAGYSAADGGQAGCGEPPLCFLRASIVTRQGNAYGATLSTAYPADSCARNVVDDKGTVWIADSYRRPLGAPSCGGTSPQVSVGFFIPAGVGYVGFSGRHLWLASDGFQSQWNLLNGRMNDSGEYVPVSESPSYLELWWYSPVASGEAYGQLQVPLRHKDTGLEAVGYVLFDVLVR